MPKKFSISLFVLFRREIQLPRPEPWMALARIGSSAAAASAHSTVTLRMQSRNTAQFHPNGSTGEDENENIHGLTIPVAPSSQLRPAPFTQPRQRGASRK
jgi:hypothetical protein